MKPSRGGGSQRGFFLKAAALAAGMAAIRFFVKGWLAPLGVPTAVGSFLASITLVLLVATFMIFFREGLKTDGRFWRGAGWFAGLAIWCQTLIIGGIFLTERTGRDTYYNGPWEMIHERFPTAASHAIGHAEGTIVMIIIGLGAGALLFRWGRLRSARFQTIPASTEQSRSTSSRVL